MCKAKVLKIENISVILSNHYILKNLSLNKKLFKQMLAFLFI